MPKISDEITLRELMEIIKNNSSEYQLRELDDTIVISGVGVSEVEDALNALNNDKMSKDTDYVTAGLKAGTTLGTGATAEGLTNSNTASGNYSHVEGHNNVASGVGSHAGGRAATASGTYAFSHGEAILASGNNSAVFGMGNNSKHAQSFVTGYYNVSGRSNQLVAGYNSKASSDALLVVGNGTSSSSSGRKNAFEVKDNGNTVASGDIIDGEGNVLANMLGISQVGIAGGVASLDSNGKVPTSQIPGTVDEIKEGYLNSVDGKFYEEDTYITEIPAETDKIYVDLSNNKTYRWSGSAYVEISESLALGETSSTAYAGNKGKANADAIAAIKNGTNINSFSDVETALSNKLNSSDISEWAKATTKPSYGISEITGITAQTTDPGAGSALTTGNIIFVYDA